MKYLAKDEHSRNHQDPRNKLKNVLSMIFKMLEKQDQEENKILNAKTKYITDYNPEV